MTLTASTDQYAFQQAYVQLWHQYVRTTVGRIFVNNVVYAVKTPLPPHLERRVKLELKDAFDLKLNDTFDLDLKNASLLTDSEWKKLLDLYKTPETRKSFREKLVQKLKEKL